MKLREYQIRAANQSIRKLFVKNLNKVILQLPTGAGKTVVFCSIINRYLKRENKTNKKVLILVHRKELMSQAIVSLKKYYDIDSFRFDGQNKLIQSPPVCVAMVESFNNSIKRNPYIVSKFDLVIIDEVHIGNFTKIIKDMDDKKILGVSATPIARSKSNPLKKYFQEIITGIQIPELIGLGFLASNNTYALKGVNRDGLKMTGGEFNNKSMGKEYSNSKNVNNTLFAYNKFCKGEKTIVFNCNVEHSLMVNEVFVENGLNSKHLDGTMKYEDREAILEWFAKTDDAILQNIGVLTTGFDEPSIRNVIVNRATTSLPLWLQMTGRGGRIYPGKNTFNIVDLGGNALAHGDWSSSIDWEDYFYNPKSKKNASGVAPVKECKLCGHINHLSAKFCKNEKCDFEFKVKKPKFDALYPEFEKIVEAIDSDKLTYIAKARNINEYSVVYRIMDEVLRQSQSTFTDIEGKINYNAVYETFYLKASNWYKKHILKPENKIYSRRRKEWLRGWTKKIFKNEISKIIA
jgi:superfamily II DNA or RNA helicase